MRFFNKNGALVNIDIDGKLDRLRSLVADICLDAIDEGITPVELQALESVISSTVTSEVASHHNRMTQVLLEERIAAHG